MPAATTLPMRRRRLWLGLFVCWLWVSLAGCVTPATLRGRHYDEVISAVLVSADQRTLVFLGVDYHYIFDGVPALTQAIASPLHPRMEGRLPFFQVDSQRKVRGTFELRLRPALLTEAERKQALSLGFQEEAGQPSWLLTGVLKGRRYEAGETTRRATALAQQPLNTIYRVRVEEAPTSLEQAAHALLTPITVAADGMVMFVAIALLPVSSDLFVRELLRPGKP